MRSRARGLGVIGVAALGAVSVLIALGLTSSHPAESVTVSLASASSQVADWDTTTTTTAPPPTTAAPAPAPQPKPAPVQHVAAPRASRSAPVVLGGGGNGFMACVRQHESGGNYATNTGNGYHGAYQMTNSHWGGYGGYSSADQAPPGVQDAKFSEDMSHGSGYMHQQYPTTSRMCGG